MVLDKRYTRGYDFGVSFWQKVRPYPRIRRGPVRDEAFKSFVRTFVCCCGCGRWPSEAAHTGDDGGMAQKSDDRTCVPLFWSCHREFHAMGRPAFEKGRGICFPEIVRELNARFDSEPKRKPAAREVRVLECQGRRIVSR